MHWLKATPFFQTEDERIELMAQFPVGEYLRQLDPLYRHPAYKTDFLLRHMDRDLTNIIIEYDGFEHHFVSHDKVNAANFERYYKPEDIERQFVLESYGYRFLRVNRFNLGDDPVATLDARLREMVDLSKENDESDPSDSVGRIKAQAQALNDKEAKLCSKCKDVRDLTDFFDPNLASGKGSYGRICMKCKSVKQPTLPTPSAQPSFYKRKWRHYR